MTDTAAPADPRPVIAYSDGMGSARIYCVRCPRPDDVVCPLDIEAVEDWDICPSCGRHCIDVARATA